MSFFYLHHYSTFLPDYLHFMFFPSVPLSYLPIRLILKPGEHLHIGASRLHCFRKATNGQLPVTDCHFKLHSALLQELKEQNKEGISSQTFVAFSYTWDFVYTGVTRYVSIIFTIRFHSILLNLPLFSYTIGTALKPMQKSFIAWHYKINPINLAIPPQYPAYPS